MYKDDSERLADYMMVWGVKSTDECVNVRSTHPAFEMAPVQEITLARQGDTVPLNISASVHSRDMKGTWEYYWIVVNVTKTRNDFKTCIIQYEFSSTQNT